MSYEYITDIQFTLGLPADELVREINSRFNRINRNSRRAADDLELMRSLLTLRSFSTTYRNNATQDIYTVGIADIYLDAIGLRSPGSTMSVRVGATRGGTFTPFLLDPGLDPITVTDTGTKYTLLRSINGGNAGMSEDDILGIEMVSGSQGDQLDILISFTLLGLST